MQPIKQLNHIISELADEEHFLPPQVVSSTVEDKAFWKYLTDLIRTECDHVIHKLTKT